MWTCTDTNSQQDSVFTAALSTMTVPTNCLSSKEQLIVNWNKKTKKNVFVLYETSLKWCLRLLHSTSWALSILFLYNFNSLLPDRHFYLHHFVLFIRSNTVNQCSYAVSFSMQITTYAYREQLFRWPMADGQWANSKKTPWQTQKGVSTTNLSFSFCSPSFVAVAAQTLNTRPLQTRKCPQLLCMCVSLSL